MTSMMDILPGVALLIVGVRQTGSGPALTAGVSQRDDRMAVALLALGMDRLVVVAHVHDGDPGRNPRAFTTSGSGMAKVDSASLAVSTRHASGRPVSAQTAWWSLWP
jgi:hypothetical protein